MQATWFRFIGAAAGLAALALSTGAGAATYHVSPGGDDNAAGSVSAPWRTLQHGVDALKPGDTLLIGTGIYREGVIIRHGGEAGKPVTISAEPGARVVVTGADRLKDWKKAEGTQDPIWVRDWPYRFPIGGPNDLTHPGDKEHELTGRAEQVIHDGRIMRQVLRRDQMAHGTFWVDLDNKKLYVWLRGSDDPNNAEMEGSTRNTWLVGEGGASYVHVRGIIFRYAANHAQRGAFTIGQNAPAGTVARGWVVEDCVFERANSSGGSFTGEGHIFRRCVFQDNGQLGFGTSRCDNTRMEECGIYRNNTKGYSTGWEAGGLKVTMSRGFVFERCRAMDNRGCGIWFDIGNEKSEVSHCYIADNDDAGIFYEISYSLYAHDNLIVRNTLRGESAGGGWGCAGITLSSSEDCVVEYNTLVGNCDGIDFREQERTTPRIDNPGAGEVRIMNRNHVVRNNLVAYSTGYNVGLWMDMRFFGPHPSGGDVNQPLSPDPKTLGFRFQGNVLWALPGRPNYLYGVDWRPKSRKFDAPSAFAVGSGIADTDRVADPRFADVTAGDYATPITGAGIRKPELVPQSAWR